MIRNLLGWTVIGLWAAPTVLVSLGSTERPTARLRMADLSDPSLEQLQERLDELGAEWHAVEAAIALKIEADKKDLAAQI